MDPTGDDFCNVLAWWRCVRFKTRPMREALAGMAQFALPKVQKAFSVDQRGLVEKVEAHVAREEPVDCLVVVGPRGSGKTYAVTQALRNREKVVYVAIEEDAVDYAQWLRNRVSELFEPFETRLGKKARLRRRRRRRRQKGLSTFENCRRPRTRPLRARHRVRRRR